MTNSTLTRVKNRPHLAQHLFVFLLSLVAWAGQGFAADYCRSLADFLNCRPYITGAGGEDRVLEWGKEQAIPGLEALLAAGRNAEALQTVQEWIVKKYLSAEDLPDKAPDVGVKVTVGEPVVVMWAPAGKTSMREDNYKTLGFERWGQYTWPKPYRLRTGQIILRVVVGADGPFWFQDSVYYVSDDNGKNWKHVAYYDKENERPIIDIGFQLPDGEEIRYKERYVAFDGQGIKPFIPGYYRLGDLPQEMQWVPMFTRKPGEENWTEGKSYWDPELLVEIRDYQWKEKGQPRQVHGFQLPEPQATRINAWVAEEQILPDGSLLNAYHKGEAIRLTSCVHSDGTLIIPPASHILRSYDRGRSWKVAGAVPAFEIFPGKTWFDPRRGHIETGFADGAWVAFYRTGGIFSSQGGPLFISRSTDEGKTWSQPKPIRPCSVNPLGLMLKNGIAVRAYGRPGAYLMFCGDGKGERWGNDVMLAPPWRNQYEENTDNNGGLLVTGPDRFIYTYTRWDWPGPWGEPRHAVIAQEFILAQK